MIALGDGSLPSSTTGDVFPFFARFGFGVIWPDAFELGLSKAFDAFDSALYA